MRSVTGKLSDTNVGPPRSSEHICAYPSGVQWTPEEIKRRRQARGWSQQQLAEALGLSRRAVTNWETGNTEPRGANLRALERELGDHDDDENVSLRDATDAQFLAEVARRVARGARKDQPPIRTVTAGPPERIRWPKTITPSAKRAREEHQGGGETHSGGL